jgi:hypothetical protein
MNERIRELWRDCVLKHTNDPMNWQMAADEFAELIIRECIDIAINASSDTNFITGISEADKRALSIAVEIRNHFGVEV